MKMKVLRNFEMINNGTDEKFHRSNQANERTSFQKQKN